MPCDYMGCYEPAANVLANEEGPICRVCAAHAVEINEKMESGKWNLQVGKYVSTAVQVVERAPLENEMPEFRIVARNPNVN